MPFVISFLCSPDCKIIMRLPARKNKSILVNGAKYLAQERFQFLRMIECKIVDVT